MAHPNTFGRTAAGCGSVGAAQILTDICGLWRVASCDPEIQLDAEAPSLAATD